MQGDFLDGAQLPRKVHVQHIAERGQVTSSDRVLEKPVILDEDLPLRGESLQCVTTKPVLPVVELRDEVLKDAILPTRDDEGVELRVSDGERLGVVGEVRSPLRVQRATEISGESARVAQGQRAPGRQCLQRFPHLENLTRISAPDRSNDRTVSRSQLEQPFRSELDERGVHRGPAHGELPTNHGFTEKGARLPLADDNPPLCNVIGPIFRAHLWPPIARGHLCLHVIVCLYTSSP